MGGGYFIPYPSLFSFLWGGGVFHYLPFAFFIASLHIFHSPWWVFHSLPLAFFIPLGGDFIPYPLHFSFFPFAFFIPYPPHFLFALGGISFLTLRFFHSLCQGPSNGLLVGWSHQNYPENLKCQESGQISCLFAPFKQHYGKCRFNKPWIISNSGELSKLEHLPTKTEYIKYLHIADTRTCRHFGPFK